MRYLLCVIFLFYIFFAGEVDAQENIKYQYNAIDSTLIISGHGIIQCQDVDKYKDKCVKVEIKDGIEGISHYTFNQFNLLREIHFPNTLKYIGKCTFNDCRSLKSLVFPPLFSGLLFDSFEGCDSLKNITFPDTIGLYMGTFDRCHSIEKLSFNYLKSSGNCFFEQCVSLESIEIKDSTCPYRSADGVLYKEGYSAIYPLAKKNKYYVFPNNITEIIILSNPYIEEIHVSDKISKIILLPCENLKLIKSGNINIFDRREENMLIDSRVISLYHENGQPFPK